MTNIDDNFFNAFNTSRCKTAMLVLSIIVVLGFVISECMGHPSASLEKLSYIAFGFWTARYSLKNVVK